MSGLKNFLALFLAVILAISLSSPVLAQSTTGTVLGSVKDQSGAVLPGVEITVLNLSTNQSRTTVTNERGDYTVPQVPIGVYSVAATLPGFKTEVRQRIEIQVDQRARIDFTLEVGQVTEKVMVTEEAPLVQATSASLGSVVDNQKIQQLPLNSRDFEKLALLVPGATPPQPGSNLSFRGGISIGGAGERGNNFTLDGISNTTHNVFTYVYKPSVDEIQEFKVQPNAYDAESGRGEGGQITVTTKSGSNALHGTVFEFLRNDKLDARNFFEKEKAPFKRNQFGGNLGGPIKKDKTFFFVNYEGLRLRQSETRTATIPTSRMRAGDFSELSAQIRDPQTGQPFPGNVIPANRLHPTGVKMMNLYPNTNLSAIARNFVASPKSPDDSNQFTFRVDHNFSTSDTFFARYSKYNDHFFDAYNQQNGFTNVPGFARDDYQRNHAATLSHTHVFGPALINTAKAGFSRLLQDRRTESQADYVAQLGIPGPIVRDPSVKGVPRISPTGIDGLGNPSNLPQGRSDLHYQYVDTMSWTKGNHSIKFGVDIARMQIFRRNFGADRGEYRFDGRYTGNPVADMIMGLPSSATRAIGDSHNWWFETQYESFFQDDWKIAPRLTLNLGMRYEYVTPWYDKFFRASNFNPDTAAVELSGTPAPQREYLRVETLDPQVAAISRGLKFVDLGTKYFYATDKNNFMPRLGFAFDALGTGKLLVRGGTGLFFVNLETASSHGNNYPFRLTQTFTNATVPAATRIAPANTFSLTAPFAGQAGATITMTARQKSFEVGYVQKYSFGFQWEFLPNFVADVDYMGSYGRKLNTSYAINNPRPSPTGSPNVGRPFAGFGNISFTESSANSNFNSLQTRIERRFSRGLTLINAYTWQKILGEAADGGNGESNYQDPLNRSENRGPASFDYRHRWALSVVYELPFGHGRRFLADIPGVANAILGGWEISTINTFQTGRPLTPLLGTDNSNTGVGNDRPDRIRDGNLPKKERTIDHYFDTGAFVAPPRGTFGNSGRNFVYGPSLANTDISFNKKFVLANERELQFRSEFFNLFNHTNFDLPDRTVTGPNFGKIFRAFQSRQIQFGLRFKF